MWVGLEPALEQHIRVLGTDDATTVASLRNGLSHVLDLAGYHHNSGILVSISRACLVSDICVPSGGR